MGKFDPSQKMIVHLASSINIRNFAAVYRIELKYK